MKKGIYIYSIEDVVTVFGINKSIQRLNRNYMVGTVLLAATAYILMVQSNKIEHLKNEIEELKGTKGE